MVAVEISNLEFVHVGLDRTASFTLTCQEAVLHRGRLTFLVGPNGAGKSTLLKLLSGRLSPSRGVVKFPNHSPKHSRRVAEFAAGDAANLIDEFSVRDHLLVAIKAAGKRPPLFYRSIAGTRRLLSDLGPHFLTDFVNQKIWERVATLSSGQRQLLYLLMTTIGNMDVLLADEPTTFLDREHTNRFLNTLHTIAEPQNCAVLVVTHDIESIRIHADSHSCDILLAHPTKPTSAAIASLNALDRHSLDPTARMIYDMVAK